MLISLIIPGSQFLCAQESFDLSDCLVYTINNNPEIRSEKLNQKRELTTMMQSKSSYLPQVDAFLNYHNYFNDLPTYIFPQTEGSNLAGIPINGPYPVQLGLPHNLNTGFEINQTIFDMGFFGARALGQTFQNFNELKLSIAEEEVLYQVAVLYYKAGINYEKLKFLNHNLLRLEKLQSIVSLQVEQGFAKQTDYDKLLVKTVNLNSRKNKLETGIKQQIGYLKLMMGLEQSEDIAINFDGDNSLSALPTSIDKGPLLQEQLIEEQRELNQMNAKKINANYYPKLQAYAAFLFQAQRDRVNFFESNQDWYNIHQWGIKLSVPIMRGFERKNKMEISEIVDAQLEFGLEQKKEQAELEFQNAVTDLDNARTEEEVQRGNVELAERIYQQSELSFEQGTILMMDLLDSESTLRESKMNYATAVLDTRLAELKILKSTGKIKELINQ